ncbi:MAG: aminotransferase class III-fold pyridoxal phosphate-dependent enzyme [Candidatus Calescibacterium sp.]|nr:aminotransferase class III-fold pyridoxal phosphate-dependent enzyme [Candidatus Calescibacterium sp.]MCX7972326.1 aminotransferase class III-fold pyridoxal phosphate-dependent enzyme [bacterium]MDW8195070.1 aminotransferase class III-fold pyridoxal phosphate-dependent enzyme [Candidatus Calescibacterium sp.]
MTNPKEILKETYKILNSDDPEYISSIYYEHINPNLTKVIKLAGYAKIEHSAKDHIILAKNNGKTEEYIDCLGLYGAVLLGHNNEYVLNKVKEQMDKQCMPTKVFLSSLYAAAAYLLANLSGLDYVFFANSGAEAIEGAIKIALASTGKNKILSTYNSYHGKTLGALAVTGREIYKKNLPEILNVSFAKYGEIQDIENKIDHQTAAVIIEPIQGEGGIIIPPPDYIPKVRELCDKYNCLLIIDEVQTGLGRTGILFEHQRYNIKPDILVLAKALGGGIVPVGAIVANQKAWKIFQENPLFHTSTFGGNPLALIACISTIEFIIQNNIIDQVREKGQYFLNKLLSINKPEVVKEIRGRGLMIGIELQEDHYAASIFSSLIKNNIITAYTLNQPKVIRIEPPYTITYEQIEFVASKIQEAIDQTVELFELA